MVCKLEQLRCKDVINVKTGALLGRVDDLTINTCTAQVVALVIYGRRRLFGLLGRENDIVIPWKDIQLIGDDTVLVCFDQPSNCHCRKRRPGLSSLFD